MSYNEKVLDHFSHPRNVGEIASPDGLGKVGNAKCGDIMQITIRVENEIIVDAKFKTFGCAAAIATSSALTEMAIGKTLEDALKISNRAIVDHLGGLPDIKIHCSVLGAEALKKAIEDYLHKKGRLPKKSCEALVECHHSQEP
jgi:nitrogen fixation protein NifU and related proteins